jgi:hypothetical protein
MEGPVSDIDKWGIDMTPEEGDAFMAAVREARHGPDPLTNLRAEVERLRDKTRPFTKSSNLDCRQDAFVRSQAFKEVLDLIDKQREQQ